MTALRKIAGQTGAALAARSDRSHQYGFAYCIARDARSKLFNHSDRFVSNDKPRFDWILTAHDVQVGAADRGQRDSNERLAHAGMRFLDFFYLKLVYTSKDVRPHSGHFVVSVP